MPSLLKLCLAAAAALVLAACGPPEGAAPTAAPPAVQTAAPAQAAAAPAAQTAARQTPAAAPAPSTPAPARPTATPAPRAATPAQRTAAAPRPTPTPSPDPTETPTPEPTAAAERVLTLRYWQAPTVPFPYLSGGDKDVDAGALTLEPLANYDPDGNLVPKLAVDIPTLDNGGVSSDLLSITWRLRDGVQWSDGSAVTAHDAVFTWRYCSHQDTGCTSRDRFTELASVEAVDDLTIEITFEKPTPYPYSVFVGSVTPIISQAQFADCVGAAAAGCAASTQTPLGTGPYRVVEFTPNEGGVYERNPHYRGAPAWFDRVILHGGGDAASAVAAVLVDGAADLAWNAQIEPDALAEAQARGLGAVHLAFASQVERIVVNQTNPDPALGGGRSEYQDGANPHPFLTFTPIPQAMSMAIDRHAIAEQLYGFTGEPTCNLVAAPAAYVSTANDGCLRQDIEGAARLLDEHGVVDSDGDGVREYQGVPLRITYQTTANEIREQTQALIRGWWQAIGIETELLQHDAGTFFGGDPVADAAMNYRRFFADVQMYTNGSGVDPQQALANGLCGNVQTRANGWASGNNARSCNAEYDQAFARLTQTPLGPEREALVEQLNDISVQQYYEIPLVNRAYVSVALHSLLGVQANGWDSLMWNVAEWRR